MPKKISIYTAFGQFFRLVEGALEDSKDVILIEEQPTDRYLFDLFPLSDYQNELTTTIDIKNFQVQTCPTVFDDRSDYPVMQVRRIRSCPLIDSTRLPSSSISPESELLNEMTPAMMDMFEMNPQSPAVTSIESRKMDEATDKMISFWNVNFVTVRRKKAVKEIEPTPITPMPSLFGNVCGYFENDSTNFPSLFENINGLFEDENNETLPSLFGKLNGLFEANPEIFTTESTSPTTISSVFPLEKYLTEATANSASQIGMGLDSIGHFLNCVCFSCLKQNGFIWQSPSNPEVPQLPVFAKSPVDSLRLYKCCPNTCSNMISHSSDCSADVEDNCETFTKTSATSPTVVLRRKVGFSSTNPYENKSESSQEDLSVSETTSMDSVEAMCSENELLQEKVTLQMEIIERLVKLNAITEKMSQL